MARNVIYLEGDKKLQRLFNNLTVSPSQIRTVSRSAGNVVKTRARKIIKAAGAVKTGNLMRGIIVKAGKNKKYASVWVGPNYGRFSGPIAPHAHLVAFKFMRSTGKVSNNDPLGQFVQRAASQVKDKVMASSSKAYIRVLDRGIKKLLR